MTFAAKFASEKARWIAAWSVSLVLLAAACGGGPDAKPSTAATARPSGAVTPADVGTPPSLSSTQCAALQKDPKRAGAMMIEAASFVPPDPTVWTLQGCNDDGGGSVVIIYARKAAAGMGPGHTIRASVRYVRMGPIYQGNPQMATSSRSQILEIIEQAMEQGDQANPRYKDQQFGAVPEPGKPDCITTDTSLHDIGVPGAQGQPYLQTGHGQMCLDSTSPPRALVRIEWSERTPPNVPTVGDGALAKELDSFTNSLAWN